MNEHENEAQKISDLKNVLKNVIRKLESFEKRF